MRKAIIIGAGPAGLTAAYELLKNTDIKPIIIERSVYVGGLSKTVNYKDNLIDIGGHRFFSKSDRIINWWLDILPIEKESADQLNVIKYQNKEYDFRKGAAKDPSGTGDNVMLLRSRVSSIYHRNKFFSYPLKLSFETLRNLGLTRSLLIIISYIRSQLFPVKPEVTLEDFLINRFGKNLYKTFFKDYTEKVWGIPPSHLPSEWGKQRIKGVSLKKVAVDALSNFFSSKKKKWDSSAETSLIEHFLYPKFGPGHLWEEVAAKVKASGGEIHHHLTVTRINAHNQQITSVQTTNYEGATEVWEADYFFSSMPVKELINAFDNAMVPESILNISNGLLYRDFITVGLLVNSLKIKNKEGHLPKDNWIYIQDDTVKVGRLQIFNNWSPYMVKDLNKVWLGLEYFCNKGDKLWNMTDAEFVQFAILELAKIGIIEIDAVTDSTILREEKAYPSYFGSYNQFSAIKNYLQEFTNLYPIGRNGMHKYNNTDHSMLTAIASVEHIISGLTDKESIWQINTEEDYHESKS